MHILKWSSSSLALMVGVSLTLTACVSGGKPGMHSGVEVSHLYLPEKEVKGLAEDGPERVVRREFDRVFTNHGKHPVVILKKHARVTSTPFHGEAHHPLDDYMEFEPIRLEPGQSVTRDGGNVYMNPQDRKVEVQVTYEGHSDRGGKEVPFRLHDPVEVLGE